MTYGNAEFLPIVLGTNLNTYNIARSLHEAYGVRTLALGRFPLRETADSRIVDVRTYRDFDDPERIVAVLRELAEEFPGRKRLLIANIEFYTNVVIAHRAELEHLYVIPLVGEDLAARLMNKTDFARTCAELGVPHPETVIATAADVDAPGFGEDLPFPYPLILKPADTDTYPRLRFEGKKKVYLVQDAAELRDVGRRIYAAGYTDDLIVQEYLAGDESVMRVVNTYSDRHGRLRFLSAAQIVLNASMLVGQYGTTTGRYALDEQTGPVRTSGPMFSFGSKGTLVFDLGQEYDFGRVDVFSFIPTGFELLGGSNLYYDGYGGYYLNGGDVIASGYVNAGSSHGGELSAQSFATNTAQKYRYISFNALTPNQSIDEIRLFDREGMAGAVPEPASWAMMIMGFGALGTMMRRRRALTAQLA